MMQSALLIGVSLLACACVAQSSCGSQAVSAEAGEIRVGEGAEPEGAVIPGTLQPCRKDAPEGCGPAPTDSGPRVFAGQHYDIAVLPTDPALGSPEAPVTLVVFSDFQCPFCAQLEPTLSQLRVRYGSELRVVWKDHPLSMHPLAMPAALLARQAYRQGGNDLFWLLHDRLFEDQDALDGAYLEALAAKYSLPWPPDSEVSLDVDGSLEQARQIGVRSTPTTFVNGRAVVGAESFETFTALIDDELAMRGRGRP